MCALKVSKLIILDIPLLGILDGRPVKCDRLSLFIQFSRKQKYKSRKFRPKPRRFLKHRSYQATDKNCFLYGKPGHWASKCPKKKSKPRLAAFCDNLDSRWWDHPEADEQPSGEYIYLPDDSESDSPSDSDVSVQPELNKFAPYPSSSDSELEANLGGFQVPDFDFSLNMFNVFMFSSPARQQELEKKIVAYNLRLSELEPYQFPERSYLSEKNKTIPSKLSLSLLTGRPLSIPSNGRSNIMSLGILRLHVNPLFPDL